MRSGGNEEKYVQMKSFITSFRKLCICSFLVELIDRQDDEKEIRRREKEEKGKKKVSTMSFLIQKLIQLILTTAAVIGIAHTFKGIVKVKESLEL